MLTKLLSVLKDFVLKGFGFNVPCNVQFDVIHYSDTSAQNQ